VVQSDYSVADQLVVKFKLARADDPSKRPIVVTDQGELATWARINRYIKDMPLTGGESSNPMGFDSTQYGDQYELMARLGQAPAFLRHRDKTWHPMRRNIVQGPNDAGGSQGESPWNAYYDPITDRLNRPIYAGSLCIETLDFSEFETTGKLVRESFAAMDVAPDSPYGATGRQPARKGMPGGGFWVGYESLSITANAMPWDPVHGRLFMVNNQVSVSAEVMGGEAGPEPRTGPYRTWVIYTRDIYDSPRGKQMRVHLLPDRPGGCYLNGPSADSVQAAIWDGMLWVISYVNPSMTVDWQTGATHPEGMRGHGNSGYVIVQTLDLGDLDADWVDRTKSFPLNPMGNNLSAYLGGSLVACEDALMAFGGYREDLPEMPQPKKWYAITRSV
jgi:hypothetical protein